MSRPASSKSFRVFKLAKPNGRKSWKVEGRPAGKRERYYFVTEKEAKTAALDLNAQIAAFGTQTLLTDEELVTLGQRFAKYFECESPSVEKIKGAITQTLARWPVGSLGD